MGNIANETNYDKIADIYIRHAENHLSWNNLYERPFMLSLFDDFSGKTILDAGCGTGFYSKYALEKNGEVIAVDASQKMLDHLGKFNDLAKLKMHKADLAGGLSFIPSSSIDFIICSLALHYLDNWEVILNEFYRVLKKSGKLYVSTHHPFADYLILKKKTYFDKYLVKDVWGKGKNSFKVFFYTRPLNQILEPFIHSPFTLLSLDEPLPNEECKRSAPDVFGKLSKHPAFLFLVLQK